MPCVFCIQHRSRRQLLHISQRCENPMSLRYLGTQASFLPACILPAPVVQTNHSSLLLVGEPEFHAEWLRDGPCDATTTGLSNSGQRCQLSLTSKGWDT